MLTRERQRREDATREDRSLRPTITKKGLALLRKLDVPMQDMYRALCGHLTKTEATQLVRLLEKSRAAVAP